MKPNLNRRDFLKITAIAGLAAGLGSKILPRQKLARVSETHTLMGTLVNFVILAADERQARQALQAAVGEMTRLIQIFDYRRQGGPLAQLNQSGSLPEAPAELLQVLRASLQLGELSGGAFDITVLPLVIALRGNDPDPSRLLSLVDYRQVQVSDSQVALLRPGMSVTLDGIAKGSVVDGGVAILRKLGFEDVLVEAGGDMMAASSPAAAEKWKIGVAHPRAKSASETIAAFSVKNQAVATSGDYMNYFNADLSNYHIIDPATGHSPALLASATVIASSAALADALSTTLMVLGPRAGLEFVEKLEGVEALLVGKDLALWRSSGFPSS